MLSVIVIIVGILLGYGLTWFLIIKSKRIIDTIDKESLYEAREIVQRLNL